MRVHLDAAATTPLDPNVEAAMRPVQFLLGNASSVHTSGQRAREVLENAREQLGQSLHVGPRELIFTSGGTEADNQAVFAFGLARGGQIITSAIEHSAVLAPARALEAAGRCQLTVLAPDRFGQIDPEQLREAITPQTTLVSIMHVNNELGSIQEIERIAEITRERGIVLHVDAVQSLGWVPCDLAALGCDLASFSAHKFYGPKGVGALYVRRGLELPPLLYGGHQEGGLRGGTHNLPGAVGMAVAATQAVAAQPVLSAKLEALRDGFVQTLLALPGVELNGPASGTRSPKHVNVTAHGTDGEALLMNLDLEGVDASSGSACSSGTLEPSHVLLALGRNRNEARSSVRFSLGRDTTAADLEFAVRAFERALERSSLH